MSEKTGALPRSRSGRSLIAACILAEPEKAATERDTERTLMEERGDIEQQAPAASQELQQPDGTKLNGSKCFRSSSENSLKFDIIFSGTLTDDDFCFRNMFAKRLNSKPSECKY